MPYTILIADDDPILLGMVQKELLAKGFYVLTATNGQTALHLAKQKKPDLIVLDVAMPLATGVKAYESLRANPDTQKMPVIFLTGLPSGDIYPVISQGSRVSHLKKPVDMDDLLSLINQFLPR